MGNIVRWFEDFPRRALKLLDEAEKIAAERDLIGSLSLLVAPSLLMAPFERLQTFARRQNPQADYLRFPAAQQEFDKVMISAFGQAMFWTEETRSSTLQWHNATVAHMDCEPRNWRTKEGIGPHERQFWSNDIVKWETRRVWKMLRDSLAHWNIVTSDSQYRNFDETQTMERLWFYSADQNTGPWNVVSVSPDAFFGFLKCWTAFLSQGFAYDLLVASAAE